jgi:hypothetical protein
LFDVTHLELADDVFATLHFEVSIGEDTTAIAFAEHHKAPFIEGAGNAGGEIGFDDAFASTCFTFFGAFDIFEQTFDAFLGGGEALALIGEGALSFFFLRLEVLDGGEETGDVTRLGNSVF